MTRILIAPLFLLASGAALADPAAIARCREIADAHARLKCYDAIDIGATPRSATPTAATGIATVAPTRAVTPEPAPAPAATFGLPAKAPDAALDRIDSRIEGRFEGWRANSMIRLANGQVWQVTDDSSRLLDMDSPKASIRRGALGSFFLEIEGTNHSPRVRRIR
ncbi:MAG TPA: hypothetical protein VFV17_09125 [Usitatibacteraceae bacterium]|nr:hypothetical protein [Usitatibacteraceae bacterium]